MQKSFKTAQANTRTYTPGRPCATSDNANNILQVTKCLSQPASAAAKYIVRFIPSAAAFFSASSLARRGRAALAQRPANFEPRRAAAKDKG